MQDKGRIKACRHCGKENTYESPGKSYKCDACGELMDWSHEIECRNCGALNHFMRSEFENGKCVNCYKPIIWTLKPETYVPNSLPKKKRFIALLAGFGLLAMSIYGVFTQHLVLSHGSRYFSAIRRRYEFFGWEVSLPVVAMVLVGTGFLLMIADHIDKRNNEYRYRMAITGLFTVGYLAYFVAFFFGERVR
ncbi:hypothetical protein [Thiosocius teredinicola]|uniref:hypothetical protein n=1 Tax=Thiosocius teredinicola TaxID=1973002 RepID=UPI000F7B947E